MSEKLWQGRFSEKTANIVEAFTSSIQIDRRLYAYDIQGSMAHCKMLAKAAVISEADAEVLIGGLEKIRAIPFHSFEGMGQGGSVTVSRPLKSFISPLLLTANRSTRIL